MISVIIPVYNDVAGLRSTLQTLVAQQAGEDFEIIVVDNGSTDETMSVAQELAAGDPRVQVMQESAVRGSYAARNAGVQRARGEILCFIDANMIVPPDYLAQAAARVRAGADYLGCRVELYSETDTPAARYNRAFGFPVERYVLDQHFAPTCCLTVKRAVIDSVGPFDSRLESGGDMEFGQRVHAAGFRQAYADDITLRHPARTSLRALRNKARRVARGIAQLRCYYPERYARAPRRILSWKAFVPLRPRHLQEQFARVGLELSTPSAILLSLRTLPLRWARPLAFVSESIRLRRTRSA